MATGKEAWKRLWEAQARHSQTVRIGLALAALIVVYLVLNEYVFVGTLDAPVK